MKILYLTDRLSDRGGADHHLRQVIGASVAAGHRVTVGFGRDDGGLRLPGSVNRRRIGGLSAMVASSRRLAGLDRLLGEADVVHAQNIMNPTALAAVVGQGRAVVTVQDHRVFCPGPGKTLPDGSACASAMAGDVCSRCLPDAGYRDRTLDLTRRRLAALSGAAVVVLSRYMADELAGVGVADATVLPPWIEVGPARSKAGSHFLLGGRLVAHKGVDDGWRAWCAAGRPLPLAVAGSGPLESELEGAETGGWLDQEGLRRALRGARALLFPARWQEPFGMLGPEALAQGTAVIVAEAGGTGDWSGSGCIRVRPGDVRSMAAAIERLADDPGCTLELGRDGQAAVGRLFSRDRIASALAELYRRVASS